MATTNAFAGSEPRNGPDLSGTSIPLKFDRAITETQLLAITATCHSKFVIYPLLQKISINSKEALILTDNNLPQSGNYLFFTKAYVYKIETSRQILLATHKSDFGLINSDLKPLLLNLNGYKHELNNFSYLTSPSTSGVDENVIAISARSIEFSEELYTVRKLLLKLPTVKYDIAISEVEDEYGETAKVPRIKNLRIEGAFSETHPLYNYTTQKPAAFTINTKEYVSCIKNGIAGEK